MKRIISLVLCVFMLLPLIGCESSSIDELAAQLGVSVSDIVSAADTYLPPSVPQSTDSAEAEPTTGQSSETASSQLPEELINLWCASSIYQYVNVSDCSAEQALEYEQNNGMAIGYDAFINHYGIYENPTYAVSVTTGFAVMSQQGIQTQDLEAKYGADAKVTSVLVCDASGQRVTEFYWVADDVLIAFGKGMYVFSYTVVDAVG